MISLPVRSITSKLSSLRITKSIQAVFSSSRLTKCSSTKLLSQQSTPSIYILSSPFSTFTESSSSSETETETETGVVKLYFYKQQYGFIIADKDEKEIFVHRNDVKRAKEDDKKNIILKQGERLQFTRTPNEKGNGGFIAKDVVFENGEIIPIYRSGVSIRTICA